LLLVVDDREDDDIFRRKAEGCKRKKEAYRREAQYSTPVNFQFFTTGYHPRPRVSADNSQ
jgi:hypothetical protein